jgi:uncharacterized membrane protein
MGAGDARTNRRSRRWLTVGVVVVGALAVLGFVAFWPRDDAPELPPQPNTYVDATVTTVDTETCDDFETGATTPCQIVSARLSSGPDDGDDIEFQVRSTEFNVPELEVGDDVVLLDVATSPAEFRYQFSDFQRRTPMLWLVGAFVLVVIVFARFQGVRALLGLAASGAVLVAFVVPALLRDSPALPVALTGTVAIAFAALYLAHGVRLRTTVALAGTLLSLAITAALAVGVASAAHLTGLVGDQDAQVLRVTADALDLRRAGRCDCQPGLDGRRAAPGEPRPAMAAALPGGDAGRPRPRRVDGEHAGPGVRRCVAAAAAVLRPG